MKPGAIYHCSILGAFLCGASCVAAPSATGVDVPTATAIPAVPAPATITGTNPNGGTLDLLSRVRSENEALYSNLQSFVCNEHIERFKGSFSGENARHIDTVTTKVSFENGVEHYTDIFQDTQRRISISSVPGAWSEGEFGTLLQQTQILLNSQPVLFRMYTDLDGTPAAIYAVEISQQNSPWDLEVERHHYRIPFHTEVWVSPATGQIMKIERISTAIPSRVGISEMRWGVTLQAVQLDQKSWLLPKTGNYAVLYKAAGRREWNELNFSGYHR